MSFDINLLSNEKKWSVMMWEAKIKSLFCYSLEKNLCNFFHFLDIFKKSIFVQWQIYFQFIIDRYFRNFLFSNKLREKKCIEFPSITLKLDEDSSNKTFHFSICRKKNIASIRKTQKCDLTSITTSTVTSLDIMSIILFSWISL